MSWAMLILTAGIEMRRRFRIGSYAVSIAFACIVSREASAATPPINCKKASTVIEKTICETPEFVAMDREIAALYDRGLTALPGDQHHQLAQGQLAFLKQRSGCAWASHHSAHPGPAINECIRDKMESRLRSLHNLTDRDAR
jgi:uncharacterized protein YecT (DUF1311 family)